MQQLEYAILYSFGCWVWSEDHRSFDIWRLSSFFSRLAFSWPNGLVNIPNYEYFNQIDDRHCSLCDQVHPFDALSCLAQCQHLTYAPSLAFDAWPSPAQQVVTSWYQLASRDEKRKFIRTLPPKSLISKLQCIKGLSLKEILAYRITRLSPVIKSQMCLIASRHPLPLLRSKGPTNYWQSSTAPIRPPTPPYRPTAALPSSFPLSGPQPPKKRKRKDTPPRTA